MRASRRSRKEREFSVPEAAAILGQLQKRISNALARELRPLHLASAGQGIRRITSRGLLALSMIRDMESWFTPFLRRRLLSEVLKPSSGDTVSVEKGRVVVNIAEHRKRVNRGRSRLEQAEALITRHSEVLGGEPCVKGTRIPAYLVGALARKHGVAETHATYPSLTRQTIELVALYVEANPRRGRPRQAELSKPKTAAKRGKAKRVKLD
jgi:uncharacterized protein (DUF433 family)